MKSCSKITRGLQKQIEWSSLNLMNEDIQREFQQFGSGRVTRPDAIRAKRRPGIAYDAVPASLIDSVIEPGDGHYKRVKSTFFRGGAPGIVFQVKNTEQVVEALAFTR